LRWKQSATRSENAGYAYASGQERDTPEEGKERKGRGRKKRDRDKEES